MKIAIMTEQRVISHRKVAQDIYDVLKTKAECTLYDWAETNIPERNILFVGTVLSTSLHYLTRFLPGKRVVFYTTLEGEPKIDPIGRNIAQKIKIVANSLFTEEMLQRVELNCDGLVYHGIKMNDKLGDPRFMQFLTTIQHPPNKPKTRRRKYLTVSTNTLRKGLDRLMIAHKLVEFTNPDAILMLHSGAGHVNIQGLADQLELSFGNFWSTNSFGMYDTFQMNSLFRFCQFYVQPSYTEGLGLPMLEAFKFQLPVIAMDTKPYNEIIEDGKTGLLLPVQGINRVNFLNRIILLMSRYSVDDLAKSIRRLLNDKFRKQLSENITKKVRMRFDSEATYPALLKYFE